MFGIGLPEMLLIMALALIVVGPDKLPDLARSLAKGLMELKKTAETLKTSFAEEGNPLNEIRPELEDAAKSLKNNLLGPQSTEQPGETSPADMAANAYQELLKQTNNAPALGTIPESKEPENTTTLTDLPVEADLPIEAHDSVSAEPQKNEPLIADR